MHSRISVGLLLALAVLAVACGKRARPESITFVHLTDPHLFEQPGGRLVDTLRLAQEEINRKTFAAALRSAREFPGVGRPGFLVITGDFGLDSSWTLKGPDSLARRQSLQAEIDTVFTLLAASSVSDVYVVAGNNDVASETADPRGELYHAAFFEAVQRKLDSARVAVHVRDLTACYASPTRPDSDCFADIRGSDLRLIGFPSYSFKNDGAALATNTVFQTAAAQRFDRLVRSAEVQQRAVIVLMHIPDLADPLQVARGVAPKHPRDEPSQLNTSAWNVDASILHSWRTAIDRDAVLAVLAGHFHDIQRATYSEPYGWSPRSSLLGDPSKLLVAPPLANKRQEDAAVSSRGLSLVTVADSRATRRIFWYEPRTNDFHAASGLKPTRSQEPDVSIFGMLGKLWTITDRPPDLARAVIWAAAFLLAFLTVIELWQIGTTRPALTNPKGSPTATQPAGSATPPSTSTNAFVAPQLQSNFARTVLAGLVGLATISVIDNSFWQSAGFNGKGYYIVLYVVLFVGLLIISSAVRGLTEAFRARIVLDHFPPPRNNLAIPNLRLWKRTQYELAYWIGRCWAWFKSLRLPGLVFLDTFVNSLQAKNSPVSAVFADDIYNLQWSLVGIVERIREEVESAAFRCVAAEFEGIDPTAVRVSITLLSSDHGSVFYLASSRRNLKKIFPKNSIAWLAVTLGVPLYWEKSWADRLPNFEFQPKAAEQYPLDKWLESRGQDYDAFIVLPLPWANRGGSADNRRGAVHISCRRENYFRALFPKLPIPPAKIWEQASQWQGMFEQQPKPGSTEDNTAPEPAQLIKDPGFRAALRQALEVLPEVVRSINDNIIINTAPPTWRKRGSDPTD